MLGMDTRPIPSAPGYFATSRGEVIGKRGFYLKPAISPNGYLHFRMSRPGYLPVTRSVHVAVCEAFHGPCPDGMEVAHGNGIKTDNRPSNLRWATRPDNVLDKIKHGTVPGGERHYNAKLSDHQVRLIREDTISSHAALGRQYGVSASHIFNIRNGSKRRSESERTHDQR